MILSDDARDGFINDLDGGPGFIPFWTNIKGDIWIDFIEAIDLKSLRIALSKNWN